MENSRNISGSALGNNAVLNQGDFNITVNAGKSSVALLRHIGTEHQLTSGVASSDDKKKFLRNISKTDPTYDKKRIQTSKGPYLHELIRWVLDHENFKRWRKEGSGIFWIKGDPGKGKTMILCGIIDEFETDPTLRTNLNYFFCQAADSRINTATAVVGGLILSMLRRNEELLSQIQATFQDQLDGPNAWVVMCEIFQTGIQDPHYEESIFIVDALDECIKDCSALLRFIVETSGRVKWLLSSRNEKVIERELRSIQSPQILSLEHDTEYTSNAIEIYIDNRIQEIEALKDDDELRIKTLKILRDKAMGTFLWVALVVEQLRFADHWEVDDVLEELPKGLENLYSLILNQARGRLKRKAQDACQVLLSIVTTAERPLHLREIYTFMSFQWEHFKSTVNLQDMESITKDCGSIFSIRDGVVYFIHQSAKDYIVKEKFDSSRLRYQHLKMFQTSIDAMLRDLKYDICNLNKPGVHIDEIHTRALDPMASVKYCCLFWGQHFLSGYSSAIEGNQKLEADILLHAFLEKKFLCWIESSALMRRLPQALYTLKKVKYLIENHLGTNIAERDDLSMATKQQRETQDLRQLIHDGYQFLLRSRDTVENWPLQLYFSAMSFENPSSAIRHTFEQAVLAHWGPSPTVASVSHSQSSSLVRTLVVTSSKLKMAPFGNNEWVKIPQFRELFFSPDSSLICSLLFDTLIVTRVDTGNLEAEITVGDSAKVAFAPDSNRIIIASFTDDVKVWGIKDKSIIQEYTLNLGDADIGSEIIAMSPNGDSMASFHEYWIMNKVVIWRTKLAVCDCLWNRLDVPQASFSPNSQLLALADRDVIRIHCAKSGNLVIHLDSSWRDELFWLGELKGSKITRCPNFSPDSKYFVAMESRDRLCLWNTDTWEPLYQIEQGFPFFSIHDIAISPDSVFLGICSSEGLSLWCIETGECISKVKHKPQLMAFSPDWTHSLLVASQSPSAIIQIRYIDVYNNEGIVKDADKSFTNVAISPDSRFVAAAYVHNREIHIWNGHTGQKVHVLKHFESTMECIPTFSPDSEFLAFGTHDVSIWSVATGEKTCLLRRPDDGSFNYLQSVAFSLDLNYLVAGYDSLYIWRIDTGQCMYHDKCDESLETDGVGLSEVAISPDSTSVAFLYGYWDSWSIQIRQWRTGQRIDLSNREDAAMSSDTWDNAKIAFASDSAVLIFISKDLAQVFEVTTGACLHQFNLQAGGKLTAFDQLNDLILTGHSVVRKMSLKHWEEYPRACYSYIHYGVEREHKFEPEDKFKPAWIVRQGERVLYLPTDFRPQRSSRHRQESSMSDSLFAFVNDHGVVVIIKFPIRSILQE